MRRLLLFLIGLGCVGCGSAVWGADPPGTASLLKSSDHLSNIRFAVEAGRIEVWSVNDENSQETYGTQNDDRHENLSIETTANHEVSIRYDLETKTDKLHIEAGSGQPVIVSFHPIKSGQGDAVDFQQSAQGPLTLTVVQKGKSREVHGPTLWHLLLAEPALCQKHLLPLLEMLRPDWRLAEPATASENRAMLSAEAFHRANVEQWAGWVAHLASDQYAIRRAAERKLRAAGMSAIPYLESLDRSLLDSEQSSCIARIVESFDDGEEDTPEMVASRVMGDRTVWLAFLNRADESSRRVAARQLGVLVGGPISFDPGAPLATREAQVDALGERIGASSAGRGK